MGRMLATLVLRALAGLVLSDPMPAQLTLDSKGLINNAAKHAGYKVHIGGAVYVLSKHGDFSRIDNKSDKDGIKYYYGEPRYLFGSGKIRHYCDKNSCYSLPSEARRISFSKKASPKGWDLPGCDRTAHCGNYKVKFYYAVFWKCRECRCDCFYKYETLAKIAALYHN